VDITALDAMEELRSALVERGIVFALARVKHELRHDLEAVGLAASIGADRLFPTLPTAVEGYREWAKQRG
jgi:MFS superfamily sulfate permease-like transporter